MSAAGEAFRSGLVTIVGRPNVGKSTLLNRLVGRKVAIVSDKPQTTRNRITGVVHRESSQIVFIDTPGVHRPKNRLDEYMLGVAMAALEEVEAILFMVEIPDPPGPGDRYVAERLKKVAPPVILVGNKADLCPGDVTRRNLDAYRELGEFAAFEAISATKDGSFELLLRTIESVLPEGPRYYPEDMVTDQPEAFLIAEIVREKVLELTREEVPHSVAVAVEELRAGGTQEGRGREAGGRGASGGGRDASGVGRGAAGGRGAKGAPGAGAPEDSGGPGLVYARVVIYAERESQKGILVGAQGRMLADIGRRARNELEALLGTRLYLDLWVKVERDWRDRAPILRALGYTLPRE